MMSQIVAFTTHLLVVPGSHTVRYPVQSTLIAAGSKAQTRACAGLRFTGFSALGSNFGDSVPGRRDKML